MKALPSHIVRRAAWERSGCAGLSFEAWLLGQRQKFEKYATRSNDSPLPKRWTEHEQYRFDRWLEKTREVK